MSDSSETDEEASAIARWLTYRRSVEEEERRTRGRSSSAPSPIVDARRRRGAGSVDVVEGGQVVVRRPWSRAGEVCAADCACAGPRGGAPSRRPGGEVASSKQSNLQPLGPQERLQQRHDLEHGPVREHLPRFLQ